MSGYSDTPSILSGWRLAAGIVGAIVFLMVACGTRPVTSEDIARDIDRDPDAATLATALRTHYPREFEAMLARLAEVANRRGDRAVGTAAEQEMASFMQSKSGNVASAPPADLRAIAAQLVTAVTELQRRDVNLCAQYVTRGLGSGRQLPDGPRQALVRLATLQLAAARHVEDGQRVNRTSMSQAEGEAWFRRIAANAPDLAPMINDGSIERATISRQCAAGVALYRAVTELPEPAAANVTAHLIRESVRSQPGR